METLIVVYLIYKLLEGLNNMPIERIEDDREGNQCNNPDDAGMS